ncbi:tetratricopeptide repeat protein,protein kinase family protein [Anopheles sinensis]|uniref:Tetratricopeptide repeat protein,protein kinase family protein n=1 Tax=Anopheles sinensis TaxID=74873 RepID=A0A084VTH9_ANOSI|nr:tetratricopeptide repeat protein,protein kinase family protein [Anopheles sinensis]
MAIVPSEDVVTQITVPRHDHSLIPARSFDAVVTFYGAASSSTDTLQPDSAGENENKMAGQDKADRPSGTAFLVAGNLVIGQSAKATDPGFEQQANINETQVYGSERLRSAMPIVAELGK